MEPTKARERTVRAALGSTLLVESLRAAKRCHKNLDEYWQRLNDGLVVLRQCDEDARQESNAGLMKARRMR